MITRSSNLRKLGDIAPAEDRWHTQSTPGLGGVPIFFAVVFVASISVGVTTISLALFVSSLTLLTVGLFDDLRPVRPRVKLLVQLMGVVFFVTLMIVQIGVDDFYRYSAQVKTLVFMQLMMCMLWIVAMINAINLLDNMDGLAGGVAMIACTTIALIAGADHLLPSMGLVYTILAAAIFGFLVLNVNPAKLFMGDVGALWIGLAVGVGSVLVMPIDTVSSLTPVRIPSVSDWILPLLICAVPVSDTLMVMVTRKLRGQAISVGGKDHLSHRLIAIGFSERCGVAILWGVAIVASALAFLVHTFQPIVWIKPVSFFVLMLAAGVIGLVRATSIEHGACVAQFTITSK